MKIKTKEDYNKIHKPIKPKTRMIKKERLKQIETVKPFSGKLEPFIPEKDRTSKPFKMKSFIKSMFTFDPWTGGYSHGFIIQTHRFKASITGAIKHAGEVRRIKKSQRRHAYLRMCR